jgi:peptidoglycan LD-endopeptidase CwlK
MTYKFGQLSTHRLLSCDERLQRLMIEALARSCIDFGISQGARTIEEQRAFFRAGTSRLNPDDPAQLKKAMHLRTPSLAVDIFAAVPGRKDLAYDKAHLCFIAGVVLATARDLKARGIIDCDVRWGGNWDRDSEIITDQTFNDLPHFELVVP